MKTLALAFVASAALALCHPLDSAAEENLFEEAGHSLSRSKFVVVHHIPIIEIALEADDTVLVESADHPAKSLAMRIDGEAVAADCQVTETKDTSYSYTYGQEKDKDGNKKSYSGTTTTVSHVTYHCSCQFPNGTTERATQARSIIVQVATPRGTTKAHELSPKALSKFQWLNK